ncbi:MAG TPA: tandem-95 repeat protein [Thermoanaerobaculia bacterium]
MSLFALIAVPVLAHDVTISGTNSFASLDGSSSDHDGAANGVFTVNDGNLAVTGIINCNDDTGASDSACSMAFAVSGNMSVNAGGALYAENRSGSGTGGAITLTVGGNLALSGNAIVSTASRSSSGVTGGAITANVTGNVSLGAGSTIDSGSANARGGAIVLASAAIVTLDGNVLSGPSRTLLATRLSGGAALDGGSANSIGGAITIGSSTFVEPAIVIGSTANIVSQGGDSGAGPITIDGCGVTVRGLVAALSRKDGVASVAIRSGKDVLIDGRDLGGSGTRMGRVRADAPTGSAINKGVDIFAAETIDIFGPASGHYVLTSLPGLHDSKSWGGLIRIVSVGDAVNGSGNVIDDGHSAAGDSGGTVEISAKEDVTLTTAVIRAVGDFSTNNPNRGGGAIRVRSYSGDVIWTNGTGEVRPIGSTSNLPLSDQGSIILTACGTVTTTGSSFPVMGSATSVFPETHTGVCSPAAPSLPAGATPLITCNTPPAVNDASASTNEDTTVTITLTGTDADGDPLTFTIVSGPANGSLGPVISTGPTSATVDYTPNLNYNGGDSFVFRANDGNGGTDDATATITIAPVNDAPSFQAGPTVSSLEDSGAQTYANWATSVSGGPADESGQTVTFTVTNSNNALFAVQPALTSNGTLTFTPAANAYGSATITITAQDNGGTANGGVDTSAPQTSTINVTGVNDEPSFAAGANQTAGEDAGAQSVSGWATAISAGPNESGQTVSFVVANNGNALFSAQPAVASNGTLTYTPAANASGSATVTIYAQDNGGTANGGDDTSAPQTFTITIDAVNDAPSFTSGGDVTVLEDSGAYSASWATAISAGPADESGQNVTFAVSNDNNSLFAAQPAVDASGNLTFTTAANASGSATVTVTLSDNGGTANGGADTSAPQTFTITITAVNDEPSFTSGGDVTANEDSGSYSAAWASAISAGAGDSGQSLTFNVSNDNTALFASQPAISAIGVLTFTPSTNANGSAIVTVFLTDDGGTANGGDDTSSTVTFTLNVNAVNDAPSFTSGGDVTALEDSGAYSAAWATAISAGPANESGQTVSFSVSNNNNALFAVQPAIDPSGNLTFTLASNTSGVASVTVTLSDNGGTANGGADTAAPQTFTINIGSVNDAPTFTAGGDVTVNEDSGAYSATWATGISSGPNESGQVVTFFTSNDNITLFSAQPSITAAGVLTFTPAPNAFGTATVSVYAKDNGGTANGGIDTSATVTFVITVNGVNEAPVVGNDAWETLGNTELRVDLGAGTTPAVGDTTPSGKGVLDNDTDAEGDPFVISGVVACADTTAPYVCAVTGGTVTLNANGTFSFQPSPGATSGSFQYTVTDQPPAGIAASANATVNLTLHDMIWYVNGSAPAGGNGTSASPFHNFNPLDSSSDVDGAGAYIFVHTSAVNDSIALEPQQKLWGAGVGLLIPRNLNGNGSPATIVAPGVRPTIVAVGDAIGVTSAAGVEVAGLSISSALGNGIRVSSPVFGGAASASIYSNAITSAAAQGIAVESFSTGTTTVAINSTDILSTGNGVDVSGGDGTVVFSYTNGSITSSNGTALHADGSALDGLIVRALANVTVTGNTGGDGIVVSSGTFDSNPATTAFDSVNGGSITVGSSANPVAGAAVKLMSASGDLAFGSLSAHGATTGVTIAGTGLYTGSAGMRVTSGGGAVSAAAGAGLTVTNTTIGSANLAFTSISSTGGANGILVNNTDTVGGLKVLGTGTAGSGGTIQGTSSDAVRLTKAANVSLSYMNLTNSASGATNGAACNASNAGGCEAAIDLNDVTNIALNRVIIDHNNTGQAGISGVGVNGLSVTNAEIREVGDADAESAILLQNASGSVLLQDVLIDAPEEYGVRVYQTTGMVSMTLRRVTVQNNIGTFGEAGASWRIEGGTATVLVDDSDFLNTDGPAVDGQAVFSGTLNLTLTANTMNENRALPHGVNFATAASGTGRLTATMNTLTGCAVAANCSQAFDLDAAGTSTLDATITNNVISNPGSGTGIEFIVNDNAFGRADIGHNTISVNVNRVGMNFLARAVTIPGATGQLHLTVANNTINGINSSFIPGVQIAAGASTGTHATTVCANVSTLNGSGANAVNGTPGPDVYAFTLRQRTNTTFQLQGFTGTGTVPTAVETFVQSNNSGGTLGGATEVFAAAGSTIVNYSNATCQTPSATPVP